MSVTRTVVPTQWLPDGPHHRRLVVMRRIMGTEVEYGISVPGDAMANPVLT